MQTTYLNRLKKNDEVGNCIETAMAIQNMKMISDFDFAFVDIISNEKASLKQLEIL